MYLHRPSLKELKISKRNESRKEEDVEYNKQSGGREKTPGQGALALTGREEEQSPDGMTVVL